MRRVWQQSWRPSRSSTPLHRGRNACWQHCGREETSSKCFRLTWRKKVCVEGTDFQCWTLQFPWDALPSPDQLVGVLGLKRLKCAPAFWLGDKWNPCAIGIAGCCIDWIFTLCSFQVGRQWVKEDICSRPLLCTLAVDYSTIPEWLCGEERLLTCVFWNPVEEEDDDYKRGKFRIEIELGYGG